jgi:hypothetical protein
MNISELSGSTKYGKFLDQVSECFPPKLSDTWGFLLLFFTSFELNQGNEIVLTNLETGYNRYPTFSFIMSRNGSSNREIGIF